MSICWNNPDPTKEKWNSLQNWEKALCKLGFHDWIFDGYGLDGGHHCSRCLKNKL